MLMKKWITKMDVCIVNIKWRDDNDCVASLQVVHVTQITNSGMGEIECMNVGIRFRLLMISICGNSVHRDVLQYVGAEYMPVVVITDMENHDQF
jgi:hypothetical protein